MDRETVLKKLEEIFQDHDPEHDDARRAASDTLDFTLSAMPGAVEPSEGLAAAVLEAIKTFRLYEELHRKKGTDEGEVKAQRNADQAEALERAMAKAIDRPAPVVEVRELEWDGQTIEGEVCAAEPYLGPRYAALPCPEGGFLVRTGRGAGYFDGSRRHQTVEAAKAACEAQWQTSVRQLLTFTTRDEVEREVIEALAVEAAAEAETATDTNALERAARAAEWLRLRKGARHE